MPLLFTSSDPRFQIYCGIDKFENERLIEWGWPEDLFFHVDDLSSAHIYLRTPYTYDDLSLFETADEMIKEYEIPDIVIQECAQLTKARSIEGCKRKSVSMIVTPWINLRKDSLTMDVGTIGFHNESMVYKFTVKTDKRLSKAIQKTKQERTDIDVRKEREARDTRTAELKAKRKKASAAKAKAKRKEAARKKRKDDEEKSYDRLFEDESQRVSNRDMSLMTAEEFEDSFM